MQLTIFDTPPKPALIRKVDPDGSIVQGKPKISLSLQKSNPDALPTVRIQLHPDDDGLWMWSTLLNLDSGGGGYKVGRKWGNFAHSQGDALFYAKEEVRARLNDYRTTPASRKEIIRWLGGLD